MASIYEAAREMFFLVVGPEPTSIVYEWDRFVIDAWEAVSGWW